VSLRSKVIIRTPTQTYTHDRMLYLGKMSLALFDGMIN